MTATVSSQAIFAGSSPNVTCVLKFDDTVDVPLVVNILFLAGGNYNMDSDYPVHMESYTRYTKTFTSTVQPNQEYLCVFQPPYMTVSTLYILIPQPNSVITYDVNIPISK